MSSHVRSLYGIKVLTSRHRELRRLKRDFPIPNLHGHQVWQSCYGVMEHLLSHPLAENTRVMDIGCGWGLLGIFCAKHFGSQVTLVDADSRVFPYVGSHELLNDVTVATRTAAIGELCADDFLGQDLLLGSDICFWPELASQLRRAIEAALAGGVRRVIIADPGRSHFMQMAAYFEAHYFARLEPWSVGGRAKKDGFMLIIEQAALEQAC